MKLYFFQKIPLSRARFTTVHVLLLAIIFAAELSVFGCCVATEPMAAVDYRSPDDRFIHTVDQMLGTSWYGVYLQEKKVGYGKLMSSRQTGTFGVTYRFSLTATMTLKSAKTTNQMEFEACWLFDSKPPYVLNEHTMEISTGKDISEIKIVKGPYGYQAKILQGNETRTVEIELFNFSLNDYLAVESWIQAKPQIGDRIEYSTLNTNTLKINNTTAKILEISDAMVNGIRITYYKIITTFAEGIEIVSVHGADGMPYTMNFGKLFEFRLEPEALAIKIDKPTDLFFSNLVRIPTALGNPMRVVRLKLGIDKASGVLISEAPGQTVESDIANGRYIVTNAPGRDPRITATFDETQKNLAATTKIPINHPKVVSLAKEAVFGADTTTEKVAHLVRFVQLYIEDHLSVEPLTLLDVIVRRKGDCSAHALLFTALARSLRIPCRMVVGLAYGGDTLMAFSPHAWNEVVVNGQWIPVDPTWGQTTIDATHLRFPVSVNEWFQVLGAVPNMKITVVDFEIK